MKPPTKIVATLLLALLIVPSVGPVQAESDPAQGTMLLAQAPPPGQWPPSPDDQYPRGQQRQPGQRRPPGQQPPPGITPPQPGQPVPPGQLGQPGQRRPPGYPQPGYPPPRPGYPPGARRPPGPGPGPGGGGWRAQALARCTQEQAYCSQMCNASYYGSYRDQCNMNCNAVYVACVNRANTIP
ncbi:MAG: hypothetical protein RDU30_14270 [Desulfovibrionaceae bacterium]|nr:hypothetical protein [Desulfovibrionaceae bacterium]